MNDEAPKSMDPTALAIPDAALLLSRAGGRLVTEDMLTRDVDDGAPTNVDGTINLVHYVAWMLRNTGRAD